MTQFDVFNGDADGICALQQLRLQDPCAATRISGLKRDIELLERVDAVAGDEVTVLDISLDRNRGALLDLLNKGVRVFYADHHYAGQIPQHDALESHIDLDAETCTSLIVNRYLHGARASWAVVGAFGDNLDQPAIELGIQIGLNEKKLKQLQQLGVSLNYNGYGFDLEDVLFHPADLFARVNSFDDPLEFIADEPDYANLLAQFEEDMLRVQNAIPDSESAGSALYLLPDEPWARRIQGVMGNDLAKRFPRRAHALLIDLGDSRYRVSVRAPYENKIGADEICRHFESGGGRQAAAGINVLPQSELSRFIDLFCRRYSGEMP